ncbi:MAG: CsgG/HfaB family protein [Stenotrophomonas sp.]|uniref:CsgG/HfaB family protein n=1 Tax=Stenotrophomonas sp. TaxID=69392 RepID=UPI003D6D4B02
MATSFSSQALPGLGARECSKSTGTLRIVEPDDGLGAWATYGLPAPTRMLRVMVNDSKCFSVLDRGVGFAAAQAERELALGGHLQQNENIGAGQMRGADFVLIPDIISQNHNAGGSHIGGDASSGRSRGLMGGMLMGLAGKMSSNKQTAQVALTLVDVRSSEQLISVTGEAKITDRAWSAMVAASSVQGQAGIRVGSWENTEIGKVIMEAYEEAFDEMVKELRKQRRSIQARLRDQPIAAAPVEQPRPMMAASLPAPLMPPSAAEVMPPSAHEVMPPSVHSAQMQPAMAIAEPQAPGAASGRVEVDIDKLASGGTLALRRTARLLAAASSQAAAVAELAAGMLLFPTGNKQGSMLEVEDEMGNKGWVPAVAVIIAE